MLSSLSPSPTVNPIATIFTEAAANERPSHETLYDYEVGYSFGNQRFHVGANLYFMDYNNQLILSGKNQRNR